MIKNIISFLKNINNLDNIKSSFLKLFLVIVLIPLLLKYLYFIYTKFTSIITVKNKYKKFNSPNHDFDDLLVIETTDGNTYYITNLFFKLDFNKEEDFKRFEIGKTYKVKGYGIINSIIPHKNIYEIISKIN